MAPRKPKVTLASHTPASPAPKSAPAAAPAAVVAEPATPKVAAPVAAAPKSGNGAAKSSNGAAKPTPAPSSADMPDFAAVLRHLAEQGMEQTRVAYETLKHVSGDASDSLAASRQAASTGLVALNNAAIDALKANTSAAFDLVTSLLSAKDLSEAIKLQADHVRRQVDVVNAQAKDLSALAQKIATESTEPLAATLAKAAPVKPAGTVH